MTEIIRIEAIKDGMVLAKEVLSNNGAIIIPKGKQIVNLDYTLRLLKLHKVNQITVYKELNLN